MNRKSNAGVVPVIVLVILGIAALLGVFAGGFGMGLWFGKGTEGAAKTLGMSIIILGAGLVCGLIVLPQLPAVIRWVRRVINEFRSSRR